MAAPNTCIFLILVAFLGIQAQDSPAIKGDISSYMRCRLDGDCLPNSFCYGNDVSNPGQCRCQNGFDMLIRNKTFYACLVSQKFGGKCTYNEECSINLGVNSVCLDGSCVCAEGSHVYDDFRCYKSVELYGICQTKANCWLKGNKYANCDLAKCRCDPGWIPVATRDDCVESKRLGDKCVDNTDCSKIQNAYCSEECRCNTGYSVSRENVFCLKDADNFGDQCWEDVQCKNLQEAICSAQRNCSCPTGKHIYHTKCIQSLDFGDPCQFDEECQSTDALSETVVCQDNVCSCKYGKTDNECNKSRKSDATSFIMNYLPYLELTFVGIVFLI